jgi:hypothetical protein
MNWDQRLKEQADRKFKNYSIHRLALDTALVDKEFPHAGDALIVVDASSANAVATVRLNRTANEEIELKLGKKIFTVFTSIYLSCSAQAGEWLDYLVGIDFDIEDTDTLGLVGGGVAKPCFVVTNATANTNTVAAAHACAKVLIKAISTNSGSAWVNFGAAAVSGSCYELVAGAGVLVSLDNTNKINALFDIANDKIIITYKVI